LLYRRNSVEPVIAQGVSCEKIVGVGWTNTSPALSPLLLFAGFFIFRIGEIPSTQLATLARARVLFRARVRLRVRLLVLMRLDNLLGER